MMENSNERKTEEELLLHQGNNINLLPKHNVQTIDNNTTNGNPL
jgi:hypothetical protein